MVRFERINFLAPMIAFAVALFLFSRFIEFPTLSPPLSTDIPPSLSRSSIPSSLSRSSIPSSSSRSWIPTPHTSSSTRLKSRPKVAFSDLKTAFEGWDAEVGCARFRERYKFWMSNISAIQDSGREIDCGGRGLTHVIVLVKGWTWIPDTLDNLYSCQCGLSCLWTKSPVMADKPDALLFENVMPPVRRRKGDPLRVYIDLEASRKPSGFEDIFIGYHAEDDVQSTYAGSSFHSNRNYHISSKKLNDTLIFWSSSRCLSGRNQLAGKFLSLVQHHSFGKCMNNVGGLDMALSFFPKCSHGDSVLHWWDHLHCTMSHYKFVLAIENTMTESYVTEKLYYALDAGAVPIYFGAPNVWDFVPPNSIIDGSKFRSLEELASYVVALADDPIAYSEFHAWRRCGVLGNYARARSASLDTLPCRLCEFVRRKRESEQRTI